MSPTADLSAVFAALADPTRRAIVQRLARGEEPVMALAGRFDISQPAVTKHLDVLERAGLITRRREGRQRLCRLRPAAMRPALTWMQRYERFWNARFDALEELLEQSHPEP